MNHIKELLSAFCGLVCANKRLCLLKGISTDVSCNVDFCETNPASHWLALSDLANKNIGIPVKFEFQIKNDFF